MKEAYCKASYLFVKKRILYQKTTMPYNINV
jgi:hypothetical protein